MKVARTVLSGGKAGDNLKGLPIAIESYVQDTYGKIAKGCS